MAKNVFISTSSCSPRRLAFATEALAPVRGLRASPVSVARFDVRGREEAGRVQTTQASRGDPHLLTSQPSLSPHVSCESYVCYVYVCMLCKYVCVLCHACYVQLFWDSSINNRKSLGWGPASNVLFAFAIFVDHPSSMGGGCQLCENSLPRAPPRSPRLGGRPWPPRPPR